MNVYLTTGAIYIARFVEPDGMPAIYRISSNRNLPLFINGTHICNLTALNVFVIRNETVGLASSPGSPKRTKESGGGGGEPGIHCFAHARDFLGIPRNCYTLANDRITITSQQ